MQADDIWLSPDYQRDSCHITLTLVNMSLATAHRYFSSLLNATQRLKPRVHWGKYMSVGRGEVERVYPRLADFAQLRKQMDPHNIFLNDILTHTFGFE